MELGIVFLIHLAIIPNLFLEADSRNFSMWCEPWCGFRRVFVPENDLAVALEDQASIFMRNLLIELQIDKEYLRAYVVGIELFRISRFICLHDAYRVSL